MSKIVLFVVGVISLLMGTITPYMEEFEEPSWSISLKFIIGIIAIIVSVLEIRRNKKT
ncbi:MAG: hypothetical protein U9O65_10180 [Thermotogota bacterium]|nr:hypothetical protein [Thermotogota bacterium]